jgi:PadR family transcriptional regulator, regulatory protein PadR
LYLSARFLPTFPLLLTSNMNDGMLLLGINRKGSWVVGRYGRKQAILGSNKADVLQGTLDLMVLKTLDSMGSQHGYGIAQRLQQVSEDLLHLNQGTLYPALLRLEQRGWISSKWGTSENNRRARFYTLTRAGRKQLQREADDWHRMAAIMARLLAGAPPTEELP